MKILVPVDGSSASVNVVKKSIEIAKKYNSSIKLISVVNSDKFRSHKRNEQLWRQVDGSIVSGRSLTIDSEEFINEIVQDSSELLDMIISKLDFKDLIVEKDVLIGEPYEKILETAKNENVDFIVIGNRGFSKIQSFFLGSVAHKVIAEAPCPVLVMHVDAEV